jgi:hypothetical protein
MTRIVINNIGPITDVDFTLNRVNVIMGAQSSGKSTIAKIVSFCQWVEKRSILDGLKFDCDFEEDFLNFHRISKAYFNKDSSFKYKSEFISITQKGLKFSIDIKLKRNLLEYEKSKNIYIPAERNFVSVIPNLGKYNETNDNIMSFLYDWFDAKRNYDENNVLQILNLGVSYSYTKELDQFKIEKNKKKILLKNASSGLQSVTPLLMLIDYLSYGFYSENRSNSVNEKEGAMKAILDKFISVQESLGSAKIKNESGIEIELSEAEAQLIIKVLTKRTKYFFTNFIIEEPEQNLFPSTQRDLIYHIFDHIVNNERPHSLFITTHSPFVLYAINNCIMGKRVSSDMPLEEQEELLSRKSWISSQLVSIWQLSDGQMNSVIDEKTGTVTKHYFNEVMSELMDEYYDMLNYFKYDNEA